MSEIQQRLPPAVNPNPVHPNAKTTTHVNNGTTTTKTNITSPVCRNCKTQTTPLWRRDETGQVLCNACGLFLKLHGRPRPISLKTDTIKSRNRIKQPNSSKSSGPNTPELKSKDSKMPTNYTGKKSPKMKKKTDGTGSNSSTDSNSLTPLLPAAGSRIGSIQGQQPNSSNFPPPSGSLTHHPHNHFSHQVQPLHYPSSTPTQFAPGLQRITSPLLLSTTSSLSNTRTSSNTGNLSAVQAAGALENMSNELGPSATFKPSSSSASALNGVSLIKRDSPKSTPQSSNSVYSTPSLALNASQSNPPKLPALGSNHGSGTTTKAISSPSFGPQFHFQHSSQQSQHQTQGSSTPTSSAVSQAQSPDIKPSLPPISQVASQVSGKPQLPNFQNNFSPLGQNESNESKEEEPSEQSNNKREYSNNRDSQSGDGNRERDNSRPNHEVTLLKTRISELELVNDLYRTRIMELEAMEQAVRLRENSLRKRLDDIMAFQEDQASVLKGEGSEYYSHGQKRQKTDH